MKRSRSSIDSVILYTTQDDDGNYIPTRYSVNSWVELNPGTRSKHAKDAAKHQKGAFKAQILQFRLNTDSTIVNKVFVQHAYMFRQLELHPDSSSKGGACNCKYFMYFNQCVQVVPSSNATTLLFQLQCIGGMLEMLNLALLIAFYVVKHISK